MALLKEQDRIGPLSADIQERNFLLFGCALTIEHS
jgi:hypothetical protein